MTDDLFSTPPPEIARDRWGRPLIIPPEGGKPEPYTRCTTFISAVDDMGGLIKWKQKMTALGLAARPDLQLAVSAHSDNDKRLYQIVEEAMEAAGASAAATTGTALHALTERVDRGDDLGTIPAAHTADLEAYARATQPLTVVDIERLLVLDEHRVAGTPDRIVEVDGRRVIADVKTGENQLKYPHKIAAQLAVYAHSRAYDIGTGKRADIDVYLERAIIIYLPAGSGRCELHWVDIRAGWEAVQLAVGVREWRSRKGLTEPYAPAEPQTVAPDLDALIDAAEDEDALRALYRREVDRWQPEHTALAQARIEGWRAS